MRILHVVDVSKPAPVFFVEVKQRHAIEIEDLVGVRPGTIVRCNNPLAVIPVPWRYGGAPELEDPTLLSILLGAPHPDELTEWFLAWEAKVGDQI